MALQGTLVSGWVKEMGIPDHLICLLRNLYAGQEATVRTGHGTTDWFHHLMWTADSLEKTLMLGKIEGRRRRGQFLWTSISVQLSSVAQLCPTLRDPMNCSMPGFPVHHQTPGVHPNPCPLSRWCHPTISWETYTQVRKQQLELDMEQQTGSK